MEWTASSVVITCCWLLIAGRAEKVTSISVALNGHHRDKNNYGKSIHSLLSDDEKRHIFGSAENIPNYDIVSPVERHVPRHSDDDYEVELATPTQLIVLKLQRRRDMVSTNLWVNSANVTPSACLLYQGSVVGDAGSRVALSACSADRSTMMAFVHARSNRLWLLIPLPKRLRQIYLVTTSGSMLPPHFLYERNHTASVCPRNGLLHYYSRPTLFEAKKAEQRFRRQQDSSRLERTVELAVFVDDVYYSRMSKHDPDDPEGAILDMVFTLVNAIQLIYTQPSLSVQIKFVLVHVNILKSALDGPSKEGGEIKRYLKSFCGWQAKINRRRNVHWDHALMLTGLDVFLGTPDNNVVIGLSWVSGMCHTKYSCSVNEGTNFESVFVISHELGHNLGMQHDGLENNCNNNTYLMSASLGPGKTSWSSCSNEYLLKYLRNDYAQCMNDDNAVTDAFINYETNKLPGEKYSAFKQCILSFGSNYRPYTTEESPFEDVCRELWCANGTVARRAHPALDGTSCFPDKVCFHGVCVNSNEATKQKLDAHE